MSAVGSNESRPVITLDGLAGSGKSTLARRLAERLGWAYLDSGAWYRALTWAVLRDGRDPGSAAEVFDTLSSIDIHAHPDGTVVVDGAPLRGELRTERIDARVPDVADHPPVRAALVERMRDLLRRREVRGVVADGRDAGTVIFPDAQLKVYVDTDLEARAARRLDQARASGSAADPHAVRRALQERDARDAARGEFAPRQVAGGLRLENTDLTVEQAIGRLLTWAENRNSAAVQDGAGSAGQDGGSTPAARLPDSP